MVKTYDKPTVERLDGIYYLISDKVFQLSGQVKELTNDEKEDLSIIIKWKGTRLNFKAEEKGCYRILVDIIHKMNQMQNPKFASSPLGMLYI